MKSKIDVKGLAESMVEEVIDVLLFGAVKHKNDSVSATTHLDHALAHAMRLGLHRDSETGKPHAAHAIARCLLAIRELVLEYEKGKDNG